MSSDNNINLAARLVAKTPLDTDFRYGAMGRLGGHGVRQAAPGNPHGVGKTLSGFGHAVRSLGTRMVNALTPRSVRAESKFRAGLEEVSKRVTDFCEALSQRGERSIDHATVLQHIARLGPSAAPVTSRGVKYEDVFSQRVRVSTEKMDVHQLLALKEGIARAYGDALEKDDADAAWHLKIIGDAVSQTLNRRLLGDATKTMLPILRDVVRESGKEVGAGVDRYYSLYGEADKLLRAHGYPDNDPKAFRDMKRALIKQTISDLVDRGDISLKDAGKLIKDLPSTELHALAHTSAVIAEPPFTMERLVTGSIGLRAEESEKAFLTAADKLLTHGNPAIDDETGPLRAPQTFAREVVDAARHLAELRSHSTIHNLRIAAGVDEKEVRLRAHLNELLSPDNLLLGELNEKQLHEFSTALKSIGIDQACATVDAEIAKRKETAALRYCAAMQAVFAHGIQGDHAAMLISLEQARKEADAAMSTYENLGTKIDGQDDISKFRKELMTRALSGLGEEGLSKLSAFLRSPDTQSLIAGLSDIGVAILGESGGERRVVGKRLFSTATDLMTMEGSLAEIMTAKGRLLPAAVSDVSAGGPAPLGHEVRTILLNVFGTEIGDGDPPVINIKQGVLGPRLEKMFEDSLPSLATHGQEYQLASGEGSGISEAMWLDLPRATYIVEADDGSRQPLRGQTGSAEEKQQQAIDALSALVAGDKEMLMLVSRHAHQGIFFGIQNGLATKDSPIRLPDGTPGILIGGAGTEDIAYTLRSDGQGGIFLRCDQSQRGQNFGLPDRGMETMELDESVDNYYEVSFEIHIAQDKTVSVSDPVRFKYDVKPREMLDE